MQQDKENFGKIAAQTYIEKSQTREDGLSGRPLRGFILD